MSPNKLATALAEQPGIYGAIHRILFTKQQKNFAYVFADNARVLPNLFGQGFLDADEITSIPFLMKEEAVNYPSRKPGTWVQFAEFDAV
jgi:hypothetical protein